MKLLTLLLGAALLLVSCGRGGRNEIADLQVLSATATSKTSLTVTFSAPVGAGADVPGNYLINGPTGTSLGIIAAYPNDDGVSVTLATEPQSEITYVLSVRNIHPAAGGGATTIAMNGSFGGSGESAPIVASAIPLANDQVLVTFADPNNGSPMVMDASAETAAYYFFSDPDLKVLNATFGTDRTTVVLTTSPQAAKEYTLRVTNVKAKSGGMLVDPFNSSASFRGIPAVDDEGPRIKDVTATSNTTVLVTFTEPVRPEAADPSHYTVTAKDDDAVLAVGDARLNEFATQVTLTTLPQADTTYVLEVGGVADRAGNGIADEGEATFEFEGISALGTPNGDTTAPRVRGAISLDATHVVVAFSEPVQEGAETPGHYSITTSVTPGQIATQSVLTVTAAELSSDRTSVRLTTLQQSEIEYVLRVTNVRDLAGNQVAPPDRDNPYHVGFLGTGVSGRAVDSDMDGLSDAAEQRGWTVRVELTDGSERSYEVTSDPNLPDTDGDGILDMDEKVNGIDPRNVDTDGDDLGDYPGDMTDYRELTDVYSDPANQDSDGDGLGDGLEFSFFRTSPTLADTDGDQIEDGDEVDLGNRNARLSDLPLLAIEVGSVDLQLRVDFSATSTTGSRELESKEVTSTLETSSSRSFSNTDTNTDEFFVKAGTEQGWNQDGTLGYSATYSVEAGYTGTWESSFTRESSTSTQRSHEQSLGTEEEVSSEESVTREISDGSMRVAVYVENIGNIAFTLNSIELTALLQDPRTGEYRPVAALVPESGNSTYNLGLQFPKRGPIVFEAVQVFPTLIDELMRNPRNLSFKVANFDITDEEGRNFAYTSQDINDRTASLVIDFGSFDSDGDGIGNHAERYKVSTSAGRPLEDSDGDGDVDRDDQRILYNGDGRQIGITLREALEGVLGLTHYDEAETPTIRLDEFELENSYSTLMVDGVEVLWRVRGAVNNSASRQQWEVLTPTGIDRSVGFDERVLRTEDGIALALVRDEDGDLLTARQEFGMGSSDSDLDSDEDGLDDRFEVAERWTVDTGRGFYEIHPSPGRLDTDLDGLSDWEESEGCVAYRDAEGVPELTESVVRTVGLKTVTLMTPACETDFPTSDVGFTGGATAPDDTDTDGDGVSDLDEVMGYGITLRLTGESRIVQTDPLNPDHDGDTVPDGRERDLGGDPTDPSDKDTFTDADGDGLVNSVEEDGWSVTFYGESTTPFAQGPQTTWPAAADDSTSPLRIYSDTRDPDSDDDGLSDAEELRLGTSPRSADTDGDGIADGAEVERVFAGDEVDFTRLSDPLDHDSDDDLRSDGEETGECVVGPVGGVTRRVATDPLEADVDNDGLADGTECEIHRTDPSEPDTDGDGVTDGNEVSSLIDSNPLAADKRVILTITTIDVNFDCDSGDNGGDFEGSIYVQLPGGSVSRLVNLDVIDGEDHDTNARIREGQSATVNAESRFLMESGQSFRFYGQEIIEATGDDHEFDDNPVLLDETYTFDSVTGGFGSKVLDDGDDCKLTFNWNIRIPTTAP